MQLTILLQLWYNQSIKSMTSKQELSGSYNNPLEELIKQRSNFVIADTFIVRNGSSEETLMTNAQRFLSNQGVTDRLEFTFYNLEEERIKEIIDLLKKQKVQDAGDNPLMLIVGFDVVKLQGMISPIETMFKQKDSVVKNINPGDITILQLNASSHMNPTTRESGIKIAALKRGELTFPTHPTPAH